MATLQYSWDTFPWQEYVKENPNLMGNPSGIAEANGDRVRAWNQYSNNVVRNNIDWSYNPTPTPSSNSTSSGVAPTTPAPSSNIASTSGAAQVTPGPADPNAPNQINVVDYAGQVATDPSLAMTKDDPATAQNESMFMQDQAQNSQMTGNEAGTTLDPNNPNYQNQGNPQVTAQQGQAAQGQMPQPTNTNTYQAETISGDVQDMQAAQGQVSQNAQIDPNQVQIDTEAVAAGMTGTGQALQEFASLELDDIDTRATIQGQLEQLQSQFVGPNGEPKIPAWAAGTARNVSKIMSFTGMTGTAGVAAMSQALMEASIPIASQDAQFYQTVSLQNLSNKQQATINRANVLAKMDMMNLDNRMAAAVQNSKNFMQMDLANLNNEQQAAVINTEQRFQALLEDGKQINAQRLFEAESQNDLDKFYAELGSQMEQFNAAQKNSMEQFNASEFNSIAQFNAQMENQRDQFYSTMQYNVDLANARWRQEVTMTEDQQAFEAAATDVQNMINISQEQLSQIWDRSDALLDYIWKSGENEADRNARIALQTLANNANMSIAQMQADAQDRAGWGSLFGGLAGTASESFFEWFDWGSLF